MRSAVWIVALAGVALAFAGCMQDEEPVQGEENDCPEGDFNASGNASDDGNVSANWSVDCPPENMTAENDTI